MQTLPYGLSRLVPGKRRPSAMNSRLTEFTGFGANPGNLRAWTHVPAVLPDRPALVVVLHGCTQTAAAYDAGAGWSQLADRHGFVVLYAEQRRANNPNLCFNWFAPEHTRRGAGEAASIHQMIGAVAGAHGIDAARAFVTGLSAGGAMASVMLAAYPETFAGGAIIAGLPYGCASNMQEAFGAMRTRGRARSAALGDLVRAASPHRGPWPTISVWHGGSDAVVTPGNADAIVEQWRSVHGLPDAPSATETVDGQPRRVWRDAGGREVIEAYRIAGMDHGTPLDTRGDEPCGTAGPFMLEAGISSSRRIAQFWGLATASPAAASTPRPATAVPDPAAAEPVRHATRLPPVPAMPALLAGNRKVIEDALRAAGLLG